MEDKLKPDYAIVVSVPVGRTAPGGTNPRKAFDAAALEELTESVKKHGVLQSILVRPWPTSRPWPKGQPAASGDAPRYEVVAGERRWRAAVEAGLEQIPARVLDLTDDEALEIQIIENLHRSDLSPLEEAEGYRHLLRTGYDTARVADRMGRSVSYVYDRLRLLDLIAEAQKLLADGTITTGHAILLSRLKPFDQKRAMAKDAGGLLMDESTVWDRTTHTKARSVREFKEWVDKHVRFDAHAADIPNLFPETAAVLASAKEEQEKIVFITHEDYIQEDARDGTRVLGPRSWKRADKHPCDHAVTGVIVIGQGRGEAFKVCVNKKGCTAHWGAEQREAKKREKERLAGGGKSRDRYAEQARKDEERRKREAAERERWKKARPQLLTAIAAAVRKASCAASGPLAPIVVDCVRHYGNKDATQLQRGKTAEDLIRYMAFLVLAAAADGWDGPVCLPKLVKPLGINVGNILDQAVPREKSAPAAKCRECGCTEDKACPGGCAWAKKPDPKTGLGLCTSCLAKAKPKKAKKSTKAA